MTAPDREPIYWRLIDILGAARDVTITYADDGRSALTPHAQDMLADLIDGDAELARLIRATIWAGESA